MTLQPVSVAPAATVKEPVPVTANGSPSSASARRPKARHWSKGAKLAILAAVVVLVAGGGGSAWYLFAGRRGVHHDLVTKKVQRGALELKIVERGQLESAENNDIACRVKARTQGSTTASTIKSVIDDGSHVTKGQTLVELDDSGLIEQMKSQKITVDTARATWISAEESYKITVSQNESDIKTAETVLALAEIDLEKYTKGDYEQQQKLILGQIETAKSDVDQYRERSAWSDRMVKKGYQTPTQADADKSKLLGAELNLANFQEQLRVLQDYTKKREVTDRTQKVAEAKRALERAKTQANAKEIQDKTNRESKKSIYEQELARLKDIEDEVKKCVITAPQDGMVVYYVSEQQRFGGGAQQGIVAQGEPVREGQKLMRIPDLNHMLVNARVHEAQVALIHEGLKAKIRVDSYSEHTLNGHVRTVATVAEQQDFFSADVKVYKTMVAIDDPLEGLKPGMSAEVTIVTDSRATDALKVPVQCILAMTDMGPYRKVFVRLPNGQVEGRKVAVGLTNEKEAEIKSAEWMEKHVKAPDDLPASVANLKPGLEEGEEVVENPRVLLNDEEKAHLITGDKLTASGRAAGADTKGMGKGERKGAGGPPSGEPGAAPAAGPRGPNAAGAAGGAGGAAGASMDPEAMKQRFQQLSAKLKALPLEKRKAAFEEAVPEAFRDVARPKLKADGIDVPE